MSAARREASERPRLDAAPRTKVRLLRLSPSEDDELRAWARREGQPVAEAVRDAALRAARWRP